MVSIVKKKFIDIGMICKEGKKKGISYNEMAKVLGVQRQRLWQLREYNRIYAIDFLMLCDLCGIRISKRNLKKYIKEIEVPEIEEENNEEKNND